MTSSQTPFLQLENIDVHYGAVQALFDVNLTMQKGEVVSVLGGNASGKSTTLKSVLGLVSPSKGRIILEGREIQGLLSPDVIDLGVASVPEGRRVFPEMSVYENLLMGAYPRRHEKEAIERDLHEVFTSFPRLAERRRQAAGTLSGGEQQMLALGRAWLRRGKLVCIDEPSMGLSPRFVDMVYQVLFRWKAAGQTILLVEQNARIALELADRAYVLQHGHVIISGTAAQLSADPAVQKAYLGAA
ncbi:ABC transporter ATP-binding protein [Neopusillimonas maritima]|jgi:branched-chain amino acid transport system ATP-binding protein|uniref:ABC transporter ATP-binding protein n=1 Tax=Neopusillimonas maritima TaxID=2026239 RepID=A0ABX9MWH1_9BURK|nr:ABC transporter ATP-binding protein [Neopusillimonas maritima]RII83315.1 ABC transporter ATP-binding protein [Neopusillimonas maritima]|tara:strand:- start:141 stop:872 length:732 start_codon:yes stop_codon:yes gene_type:complete